MLAARIGLWSLRTGKMLVGNKVLTLFTNIITNLNLTDMETRYKVLRQKVIREPKANGECTTFQFLIWGRF